MASSVSPSNRCIDGLALSSLPCFIIHIVVARGQERLLGIWAMTPLNNGIATVVEFKADGKSNPRPFSWAHSRMSGWWRVPEYRPSEGPRRTISPCPGEAWTCRC